MSKVVDYVIEGILQNGDRTDVARDKLAVHALIRGKEVARAKVDPEGHYELAFQYGEQPPQTELRVGPMEIGASQGLPSGNTVSPSQYILKQNKSVAELNIHIPELRLTHITYHMYGKVVDVLTYEDGVGGVKMDFYEVFDVDTAAPPPNTRPTGANYLGTSYSDPDGRYTFTFVHTELLAPPPFFCPYVMVEISQFTNGIWTPIYLGPIDHLTKTEFHRGVAVPLEDLQPSPGNGVPPDAGFRFNSIGLLPCDDSHFIKGYFSSQPGDPQPIAGMSTRPLCGMLRIYGLFANKPEPVLTYKVQLARVNANYVAGDDLNTRWEDVTDPLVNLRFNDATKRWDPEPLGPSPDTHLYTNVDRFPEGSRIEHSLKVIWNSANYTDGFYVLRIETMDSNNQKSHFESRVICIDNSLPEVKLEPIGAKECGQLMITGNALTFKVTAYDLDGHILDCGINAFAGRDMLPVAIDIEPAVAMQTPGTGIADRTETITITNIPSPLQACSTLAYRFDLWVQSSATDGYTSRLSSKQVTRSVNLIVSEP